MSSQSIRERQQSWQNFNSRKSANADGITRDVQTTVKISPDDMRDAQSRKCAMTYEQHKAAMSRPNYRNSYGQTVSNRAVCRPLDDNGQTPVFASHPGTAVHSSLRREPKIDGKKDEMYSNLYELYLARCKAVCKTPSHADYMACQSRAR